MNLTEPNPAGLVVNVSSSSIIGPAFDAAIPSISIPAPPPVSYTPSYIPPQPPQPPQPQQQNMQQTINDIIASITNAITQSSNPPPAAPPVPFAPPPVAPQSPVAVISVMSPAAVTAAAPAPVPVPFAVPVFAPAPPTVYAYPTPVLSKITTTFSVVALFTIIFMIVFRCGFRCLFVYPATTAAIESSCYIRGDASQCFGFQWRLLSEPLATAA